jgi:hypothetical protein
LSSLGASKNTITLDRHRIVAWTIPIAALEPDADGETSPDTDAGTSTDADAGADTDGDNADAKVDADPDHAADDQKGGDPA